MTADLNLEIIAPDALCAADADAWRALRGEAGLDHPYFDPRFAEAAAGVVPGGQLAMFRQAGRLVGVFPFQRRGRLIQPLAAPFCDYHGVIATAESGLTPERIARMLGGTLRFNGWMGPAETGDLTRRQRMGADVTGGLTATNARLKALDSKFFKNLGRMRRGLARDHGDAVLVWDDRDPAVLDWIVDLKRAQYRRTRRHDVFACGWTRDLLHSLWEMRRDGSDYGLRVCSLRTADGRIAAAEVSLDDGRTLHLWFPVYDPAFSRYGPGLVLTWMEMEKAAEEGYVTVDYGCGEEGYKSALAQPIGTVLEGEARGVPAGVVASAVRRAVQSGPDPVRRLSQSIGRRLDIIDACETRPADWWAGAARAAVAAARKSTAGAAA